MIKGKNYQFMQSRHQAYYDDGYKAALEGEEHEAPFGSMMRERWDAYTQGFLDGRKDRQTFLAKQKEEL